MARVNMMKTIVSDRRQPHSPLDNVNTPYNPIRLLKGAPPGQEAVNHYISELSIEKKNNTKLSDKERKHLVMLEVSLDANHDALRDYHPNHRALLSAYTRFLVVVIGILLGFGFFKSIIYKEY